ncbi:hypothetical protein [Cupriavidus sp. H18C2]|uniref:hypothetical protein n=1 Tax=Cupriavidus sp. H18C2 TaxID=3241602 RepID=UPI003BF788CF
MDPQEVARLVADVGIGAAAGIGATDKYSPNAARVDNMRQLLSSDGFGSQLNGGSRGTPRIYKRSRIFVATKGVGEKIRTGDQFYIDSAHMNHLEVFDNKGRIRVVLNPDGSVNEVKTVKAIKEGRRLK